MKTFRRQGNELIGSHRADYSCPRGRYTIRLPWHSRNTRNWLQHRLKHPTSVFAEGHFAQYLAGRGGFCRYFYGYSHASKRPPADRSGDLDRGVRYRRFRRHTLRINYTGGCDLHRRRCAQRAVHAGFLPLVCHHRNGSAAEFPGYRRLGFSHVARRPKIVHERTFRLRRGEVKHQNFV